MENRTALYDDLSETYDLMVNWPERLARESPFFEAIFSRLGARRILDVGCGTGWHAIHFARLGFDATATDPSAEMLRLAKANGAGEAGVRLIRASMGELYQKAGFEYDVVTCLGNTLPHLLTQDDLVAALADMREVLRPGGILIVQQLNYDRILAQRQRFLGLTAADSESGQHLFFRFYDFGDSLLTFNVARFVNSYGKWSHRVDSTTLQPITSDLLKRALRQTGLGSVELFGDYSRRSFDSALSNDLVVLASRC